MEINRGVFGSFKIIPQTLEQWFRLMNDGNEIEIQQGDHGTYLFNKNTNEVYIIGEMNDYDAPLNMRKS